MFNGLLPDRLPSSFDEGLDFSVQAGANIFGRMVVDLPSSAWWFPALILLVLLATALYDAAKGRVPDAPIFFSLILAVAVLGLYVDWPVAAAHLALGIGAAVVLWGVNQAFFNLQKQDAIGMGDAKWTALAVTVFSYKPLVWAWIIGAWLGLSWMGIKGFAGWAGQAFIRKNKPPDYVDQVHFAPFLFLGLLFGLYWTYLR